MTAALPPGQIETQRFPVVGERAPSEGLLQDPASWSTDLVGLVRTPLKVTLASFMDRADQHLEFDVHCVTSWTRRGSGFTGLPLRLLLDQAGVSPKAKFVSFEAYSKRGHSTSLPLDVARDSSWLVHSFEGEPLSTDHGGPVRLVTPGRYFYKSIKWLKRIEILEDDRLGWWEKHSFYHNNADPRTGAERFTTGSLRPDQRQRFLEAHTYDKYRGRVLLGLDLRGWAPETSELRRLYLKNCDLRGVDFSGCDLRESNLSLSNLSGADLSGADLAGSDLEGALFIAADLSGANLTSAALSATKFVAEGGSAKVDRINVSGAWGLLESQEAFLGSQGVDISRLAR